MAIEAAAKEAAAAKVAMEQAKADAAMNAFLAEEGKMQILCADRIRMQCVLASKNNRSNFDPCLSSFLWMLLHALSKIPTFAFF